LSAGAAEAATRPATSCRHGECTPAGKRRTYIEECAKLDLAEERALAEEGLAPDLANWPEY
jgi:hypothetical protein